MSLDKTLYRYLVVVQSKKTHSDMTEKLLTGVFRIKTLTLL